MFCWQCEQTAKGEGCASFGVCGKDPDTASLQDVLVEVAKGLSMYAHRAGELGVRNREADLFVAEALFTTVTNVNFDVDRLAQWVARGVELRTKVKAEYEAACAKQGKKAEVLGGPAAFVPASDNSGLVRQGEERNFENFFEKRSKDVVGLEELVLYGLKGSAAYLDHAHVLGVDDDAVFAFFHKVLDFLSVPQSVDALVGMALEVGKVNLRVMEMLDQANTSTYGHPVPTAVRITAVKGKAILVSGHDLKDLELLLKQTEGKGVNIYTHGEMLPTHAYPELKKFAHLVGNYGGAWQDQRVEFESFPDAILMTTNCIQKPKESYKARIFTSGLVAWPGVAHIADGNFAPLIQAALEAPGFAETEPEKTILVGFGHNAVLGVADKVIEAVKSGAIKRFFLIGGCDGAKPGRNYYTELAQKVPQDSVILTLACGKFRFNKMDLGNIGGLPRMLDIGQCNDAYSAIQIAVALANAFETDVNSLPLSMVLSWYEQKAVTILLTLLHLGIRNIRIGPSLPAFLTPAVVGVLHDKFSLMAVTTPDEDLKAIFA